LGNVSGSTFGIDDRSIAGSKNAALTLPLSVVKLPGLYCEAKSSGTIGAIPENVGVGSCCGLWGA